MRWWLQRLIFGDRRRSDRVLFDTRQALRRLDQALSSVELAADHDRRKPDDPRR